MAEKINFASIDEYIAQFPLEIQAGLQKLRETIRESAPDAQEKISYQMPAFFQDGPLVYFAVHQKHIGFYPTAEGMEAFQDRFVDYKTSKGAVQFPLDKPLPLALVAEIVRHRLAANAEKADGKRKRK